MFLKVVKLIPLLALTLFLGGCLNPLDLITGGGGPKVAANVQVGKENNQTGLQVGDVVEAATISNGVTPSGDVGKITVFNTNVPPWVILLLILGWLLPTPKEIWSGFLKTITLGKYRG